MQKNILPRGEAELKDILLEQLHILGGIDLVVVHKGAIGGAQVHDVQLDSSAKSKLIGLRISLKEKYDFITCPECHLV